MIFEALEEGKLRACGQIWVTWVAAAEEEEDENWLYESRDSSC